VVRDVDAGFDDLEDGVLRSLYIHVAFQEFCFAELSILLQETEVAFDDVKSPLYGCSI